MTTGPGSRRDEVSADLVLSGGLVRLDAQGATASALAVRGDRVVHVGTEDEIASLVGPGAVVVDLGGRTVLPGINDAHLHLTKWSLGREPYELDVRPERVGSRAGLTERLREYAAQLPAGEWVIGRGWTLEAMSRWTDGAAAPHADLLDDALPGMPVLLWNRNGHAAWASSAALALAGVDDHTPDPPGGRIVRDDAGHATGYLVETATAIVAQVAPAMTSARWDEALMAGMAELARRGYTSVTDPMVEPADIRRLARLREAHGLSLRVAYLQFWDQLHDSNSSATIRQALAWGGAPGGLGDLWLRCSGVKLFADGVPPLRTSWMSGGYLGHDCADAQSNADTQTVAGGALTVAGADDEDRLAELAAMVDQLHTARVRLGIHATGDRTCAAVADLLVAAMERDPWPARHHVIHGSFLSPADARRLAAHDVTVNTNALIKWQATTMLAGVLDEPTNARHHPVRSLLEAGVHVSDGSDAPITQPDWRRAFHQLVTRTVQDAEAPSGVHEAVTRSQALGMLTSAGAYQDRLEADKGCLHVGQLADLVVLDRDPLTCDIDDIPALNVDLTLVGGRATHDPDGVCDRTFVGQRS